MAATGEASVLGNLSAGSTSIHKEFKLGYIELAQWVNPHRGGNFSAARAESSLGIAARV